MHAFMATFATFSKTVTVYLFVIPSCAQVRSTWLLGKKFSCRMSGIYFDQSKCVKSIPDTVLDSLSIFLAWTPHFLLHLMDALTHTPTLSHTAPMPSCSPITSCSAAGDQHQSNEQFEARCSPDPRLRQALSSLDFQTCFTNHLLPSLSMDLKVWAFDAAFVLANSELDGSASKFSLISSCMAEQLSKMCPSVISAVRSTSTSIWEAVFSDSNMDSISSISGDLSPLQRSSSPDNTSYGNRMLRVCTALNNTAGQPQLKDIWAPLLAQFSLSQQQEELFLSHVFESLTSSILRYRIHAVLSIFVRPAIKTVVDDVLASKEAMMQVLCYTIFKEELEAVLLTMKVMDSSLAVQVLRGLFFGGHMACQMLPSCYRFLRRADQALAQFLHSTSRQGRSEQFLQRCGSSSSLLFFWQAMLSEVASMGGPALPRYVSIALFCNVLTRFFNHRVARATLRRALLAAIHTRRTPASEGTAPLAGHSVLTRCSEFLKSSARTTRSFEPFEATAGNTSLPPSIPSAPQPASPTSSVASTSPGPDQHQTKPQTSMEQWPKLPQP
jgi:hypothetical protein